MSLTLQQTVDEILSRFNAVWQPLGYETAWPDVPLTVTLQNMIYGVTGVELAPWARVTVRPNVREQRTFGSYNNRIFTRNGIAFIEIFVPTGDGNVSSYSLAEQVAAAFEQPNVSSLHTWFKQTRIENNGVEGLWSRNTVTVAWESEELK